MADVADKVDDTIENLLLAIQNVRVVGDFSNIRLNEVRIAAIYLSAAVMDCLTSLIDWVTRSRMLFSWVRSCLVWRKAFITTDFDQKLTIVHTRSGLYTSALQSQGIRKRLHDE